MELFFCSEGGKFTTNLSDVPALIIVRRADHTSSFTDAPGNPNDDHQFPRVPVPPLVLYNLLNLLNQNLRFVLL